MITTAQPLAIIASGMVTSVGHSAASSCAAIRCGLKVFDETDYLGYEGAPVVASCVRLSTPMRGIGKLAGMAIPAIRECLAHTGQVSSKDIALILCVAEEGRPGRFAGLEMKLFQSIANGLGTSFHPKSTIVAEGRTSIAKALKIAHVNLYGEQIPYCVIVGVDSLVVARTIQEFDDQARIQTTGETDGFVPGEAGAAILLGKPRESSVVDVHVIAIGESEEPSPIGSRKPLRGDGLLQAMRNALGEAQYNAANIDYRITDANGEPYWHKETTLAMTRILQARRPDFPIWHIADSLGEVGAAVAPCAMAVTLAAARKGYAPGPTLLAHFSGDGPQRVALILKSTKETNHGS